MDIKKWNDELMVKRNEMNENEMRCFQINKIKIMKGNAKVKKLDSYPHG